MKKQLLLFVFLALLTSCDKENDEQSQREAFFRQGWKLTEMKINGTDQNISERTIPELMFFTENNLCYLAEPVAENGGWKYQDARTAWNYDYDNSILNIAVSLPVTYHVDAIDSDRLVIHYYVYNDSGDLDTVEKGFIPARIKIDDLKLRLAE